MYGGIRQGLMGTPMPQEYGQDYGNAYVMPTNPMASAQPNMSGGQLHSGPGMQSYMTNSGAENGSQNGSQNGSMHSAGGGGNPNNPLALIQRQNHHIMSGAVNNPGQDYMYKTWLNG